MNRCRHAISTGRSSVDGGSEQVGSSLETNMATSDESDYCAYRLFLEFLVQKDEACVYNKNCWYVHSSKCDEPRDQNKYVENS